MFFRALGSGAKLPLPYFALALFGADNAIWRRPGQIAVAADDETDLYFGIAARRRSADVSLGAPNVFNIEHSASGPDLERRRHVAR